MSLDTTVPANPSYILSFGVQVSIFPSDQSLRIEVWRAPDNGSGAPNDAAAVVCNILPPSPIGGVTFIDILPSDNAKRYYKSRHIDDSGNVSAFTNYSDGQVPVQIAGANEPNPMAAFGAIVDQAPPNTLYEMRMAASYTDPDTVDGMQSYIDFPAVTNFMRIGQTPKAIVSSTAVNPSVVTVTAHGYVTGDAVTIRGHLTNTAINGTWTITVLTNDTFSVAVLGNGAGGATGHVVRLSLTIDSFGNLVVYAIIRAVSLVVSGVSTFNGVIRALAGTLVRSLQHSTAGEYGATNVNRIMLDNNAVLCMGDAGTGTNNEAVRLGSHSIAATPVARTTAAFNIPATGSRGWTDPDGTDNGFNIINGTNNQSISIAAASALYQKLGVTTEGDFVDAFDDNYKIGFAIFADYLSGGNPNASVVSVVTVQYATDGTGTTWTNAPGSWSVTATGGSPSASAVFSPTIVVTGNPAHVWFRLLLTTTGNVQDSTFHSGTWDGGVQCYATVYKTDNYSATWSTASGALARRGVKHNATDNGTDKMPHGYLEPITAATPDANSGEGEYEYVAGTLHGLGWHDDEQFRWVNRVLGVETNLTTTAASDTKLTTGIKAKTDKLNATKRTLRIRAGGTIGANAGGVALRVGPNNTTGDTSLGTLTLASNDKWYYEVTLVITITGASGTARVSGVMVHGTVLALITGTVTINTTADIFVNISGSTTGAVVLTMDLLHVEHLISG